MAGGVRNNARTHSDAQITQIAASIAEFGFVNPILLGTDNVIIAGHARAVAARQLGLNVVPVIILEHLGVVQCRALVLADNRLALSADRDEDLLHLELAALREEDFNLDVLGFDDGELAVFDEVVQVRYPSAAAVLLKVAGSPQSSNHLRVRLMPIYVDHPRPDLASAHQS